MSPRWRCAKCKSLSLKSGVPIGAGLKSFECQVCGNKTSFEQFPGFHAKDYGAAGDGQTDDTQAIQNAMDTVTGIRFG